MKRQNDILKQEMETLKAEKDYDRRRIAVLEDQFKRNNLIFKGLPSNKSAVDEIKKVCNEILEIPDTKILKSAKKLTERNGKATVLAELDSEQSVYAVLGNTNKLRGTEVYIEKDLNPEKQKDKRAMLSLKKDVLKISKVHRIVVRDDRIRIGGKWFKWNLNKQLVCGNEKAEPILKQLYGEQILGINLEYQYLLKKISPKN